jgi:hypothetical protein
MRHEIEALADLELVVWHDDPLKGNRNSRGAKRADGLLNPVSLQLSLQYWPDIGFLIAFEFLQSLNNNSSHSCTMPDKIPENNEFQRLAVSASASGSGDLDSLSCKET